MDLRYGSTDVMRFYLRDGKIRYHDGSFHDVMSASSNTWYHMKLVFAGKVGVDELYAFDLYVNDVLEVEQGNFYSNQNGIDRIGIDTSGDIFNGYFDAFGYSWDNDYDVGDNKDTYDCDGTPFELGVNVIVIPTERFTETLLHSHLENGTLDETALYHSDEYMFEFVSNDRDGTISEANSDVDFFFMRRTISPEDAMKVLELVLRGLLNESVDESNNTVYQIGWINDQVSTKLNGTKATQMNLPYSVLGYIPWLNNYTSSKMGPEPEPNGGFDLILWLLCLSNPILNNALAMAAVMTGGEIFAYLADYCTNVFMNVLTAVGDLVWTLIRAAILILVWILFGFTVAFLTLAIAAIALIFFPFSLLFGAEMNYSINSVSGKFSDFTFGTGYEINMNYYSFFDIWAPFLYIYFLIQENVVFGGFLRFYPPSFEFYIEDAIDFSNSSQQEFALIFGDIGLKSSDSGTENPKNEMIQDGFISFLTGMDFSFGLWSTSVIIATFSLLIPECNKYIKWSAQMLHIIFFFTGLIIDLVNSNYNKYETFWFLIGSSIVSLFTGLNFYHVGKPKASPLGGDDIAAAEKLYEVFQDANGEWLGEFLGDLIRDLPFRLPRIAFDVYFDLTGQEEPDWVDELILGIDIASFFISAVDWAESFDLLSILSYLPYLQSSTYETDLKVISYLAIVTGIVELALAVFILFN